MLASALRASDTITFMGSNWGAIVSTIRTFCTSDTVFSESSVAVQVTVVFPSAKYSGASLLTYAARLLSVTFASPRVTVFSEIETASCTIAFGTYSTGDSLSTR